MRPLLRRAGLVSLLLLLSCAALYLYRGHGTSAAPSVVIQPIPQLPQSPLAPDPPPQPRLGRRALHNLSQPDASCRAKCCMPAAEQLQEAIRQARGVDSKRPARTPAITKVSYIKTHKTASSTLGSIIYRYAANHRLRLYKSPAHGLQLDYINPNTTPANVVVYHYAGIATNVKSLAHWEKAYNWYNKVVPGGAFVTILREPLSHYTSYYYFYNEPARRPKKLDLAAFARAGHNPNILMRDFGVGTREEMDAFMQTYAPQFKTILLSNRMEESLAVMAFDFGWPLLDMAYLSILDSHKSDGLKRWDGRSVKPTPRLSSLPQDVVDGIRKITELDQEFYEYAEGKLNQSISSYGGPIVRAAALALKTVNKALSVFCMCTDMGNAELEFCRWLSMSDMKYEKSITREGTTVAPHIPWLDLFERVEEEQQQQQSAGARGRRRRRR